MYPHNEPFSTGKTPEEMAQERQMQRDINRFVIQLKREQNMTLGTVFGLIACAIAALVWAGITVVTGYQASIVAIGVGYVVGFAVQLGGRGVDPQYGALGGALSLLSVLLGNILSIFGIIARQEEVRFMEVALSFDYSQTPSLLMETFDVMDLVFYGIAVLVGFGASVRSLEDEIQEKFFGGTGE